MSEEKFFAHLHSGILDSFSGSCGRLLRAGHANAAIWLLVDHIILLFQLPIYLNLAVREGARWQLVYSSLPDPDRAFLGLPAADEEVEHIESTFVVYTKDRHLAVGVFALPSASPARKIDGLLPPTETRAIRETISELLHRFRDEADGNILKTDWQSYVASTRLRESDTTSAPKKPDVVKLQSAVGSVLDAVGKSRLTESASGRGTNLFAVARFPARARSVVPPKAPLAPQLRSRARVDYQYSLKLLLSPEQCDWLRAHNEDPEHLSEPIPYGSRSIADTPIAQGNVDFSVRNERRRDFPGARQYYSSWPAESKARKTAEDSLYQLAFDGDDATGEETLFYVPVHLSGIPWLALFTFNRGSRGQESMMRNYHLYRDLVPLLSESVSLACQNAFGESLADAATSAFEEKRGLSDFIDVANEGWQLLSGLYPYGAPRLSREGPISDKIDIGLPYSLFLSFAQPNEILPYRTLNVLRTKTTVIDSLQKAALRLRSGYHQVYKDALFVFGHQAGKLFQESGLTGFTPSIDDVSSQRMKNRLFLAWGMAEAIRALKYEEEGLSKDWFDSSLSTSVSLKEAIETAISICRFYIAGAAATLDKRLPIRLSGPELAEEITVADTHRWLSKEIVSLCPLRSEQAGKLGTLALTFGLAELIRNAFHHVLTNSSELLVALADQEISGAVVDVSIGSAGNTSVRVIIKNRMWADESLRVDTLRRIQEIERSVFAFKGKRFVQSSAPERDTEDEDITWAVASWEFDFDHVMSMVRSWQTPAVN